MSTQAHTAVRDPFTQLFGWSWCTTIERYGETLAIDFGYEPTRDEATAAAHNAIARLTEQLMDEVHASRGSRRTIQLAEVANCTCGHGQHEHVAAERECHALVCTCPTFTTTTGIYTLEATA